jgi:hypothetical protein
MAGAIKIVDINSSDNVVKSEVDADLANAATAIKSGKVFEYVTGRTANH